MKNNNSLREQLEELVELNRRIESTTRVLQQSENMIMGQELGRQIAELNIQNERLMDAIISQCSDSARKEAFFGLSRKIQNLKLKLQASQDIDEISLLEGEILRFTDQWVISFQEIVATILQEQKQAETS